MIFHATQAIADIFDRKEIIYRLTEGEKTSRIRAGVSGEYSYYDVQFSSSDDDNDVSVRIFNYLKYPKEKLKNILRIANDQNNRFRYLKFVVDIENECVRVEYDFPVSITDPAECAVESFYRVMKIVDEAYPAFMREIWGSGSESDSDSEIHDVLWNEIGDEEAGDGSTEPME